MRSAPSFKQTFSPFFTYPLLFLSVQSIQGLLSLLESALEPRFSEKNPILLVALFFPPYVITTTLSSALTFFIIRDLRLGKKPTFRNALEGVKPHLSQLIICSLVLGMIYILGFCAFVVPVVYFMAIYLFVPFVILTEPKAPFSAALYRSTQLAKTRLGLTILTVIGVLAIGLLTFALSRWVTDKLNQAISSEEIQLVLSFCIDFILTIATGSWIDSWVSHYYLNLKEGA